jgi:hypothetical protein
MRVLLSLACAVVLLGGCFGDRAAAQSVAGGQLGIEWEVKNRFRLFRSERDFQRHVAVHRSDGVLAAEARLAQATDGRGWARDMVERLCVDRVGKLIEQCERDGHRENYLSPQDHRIGVVLAGVAPANATCAWSFDDGESPPKQITVGCEEEVRVRVRYGRPSLATVDVILPSGLSQRVSKEILVRDLLIAGLGDSIGAGEGNPDRAILLDDYGFCFRRFTGSEYYRPGRAGYTGSKACETPSGVAQPNTEWMRHGARWLSAACHRSLYGYQMRTALALAIEHPHVAVTFLPLACSGATIDAGLFNAQRARECDPSRGSCASTVPGQLPQLQQLMTLAQRQQPDRRLDVVLLTIGGNDIHFSGLVADVIVEASTERLLFARSGVLATVEDSQRVLDRELPASFAKLRAALKPFVDDLARVVFVSYGHPALSGGTTCNGGRDGFDIHPAFTVDPARLHRVAEFVSREFLPKLKALARCENGAICRDPAERMTFVDSHQAAFANHGFCVRSDRDPDFDRECFSAAGESFETNPAVAISGPLVCDRRPNEFRPYASRARWFRTANDSYFSAMTFPEGRFKPSDIHDATWAAASAVYGGAIHPTAEGHAAMADAALPALRSLLGLPAPAAVTSAPLPSPVPLPAQETRGGPRLPARR